jgi:metallo-beta-lactamase class B
MTMFALLVLSFAALFQNARTLVPDPPATCDSCDGWNAPHAPFRVFGNTYYVGTKGLSALLITTDAGLILLDGALPQSAPLIDANIRALGFRTEDVKLILNSHAHYDHSGGIAALQRFTGATVAASAIGARSLERGESSSDDPQYGQLARFAPATHVRTVGDGEELRVGGVTVTAHLTPGHTPGGTTWAWRSCEGARCLNVVYADSLTAVSADGYRFTGDATHPSIVEPFRRTLKTVEQLPCDIIVSTHPDATDVDGKLQRRAQGRADAFIDPQGCRAYAARASKGLDARIAEEQRK